MTSGNTSFDRDAGFTAWLAMNDYLIEDFLDNDVTGMPDDPFGEDGLRSAETEALRRFDSAADALADPNRDLYDKFVRFLGEAIARGTDGQWTNKPTYDDGKTYLGLRFPWRKETLAIPTLFTAALARRTGEEWTFVYRSLIQRRNAARG